MSRHSEILSSICTKKNKKFALKTKKMFDLVADMEYGYFVEIRVFHQKTNVLACSQTAFY